MPGFTTADRIGGIGGYVGGLNALLGGNSGGVGGILGNVFGNNPGNGAVALTLEQNYVSNKELGYVKELSCKDMEIVQLRSEKVAKEYTDSQVKPLQDEICTLKAALAMESERRVCGDENIYSYVNGRFIPGELQLNSRDINYHGVRPVVEPTHRHKHCGCPPAPAPTGTDG